MNSEEKQLIPLWPAVLGQVDIVKLRFTLDFLKECVLCPADFLGLGRIFRLTGRQLFDARDTTATQQWEALFQPVVSNDPVARRKFQKPAPAFVLTMPIREEVEIDGGDSLHLEVLFLGTGIPSIHYFLRSLMHLGQLGLVAGEGQFDVTDVNALQPDGSTTRIWRQTVPVADMACPVQNLLWWVQREQVSEQLLLRFTTPTRLMTAGKPLRQPHFSHLFPFLLRRVTSMLHAHCGLEVCDDPVRCIALANELELISSKLTWKDWRSLKNSKDFAIGGFIGDMVIKGIQIEELYWVLAVASLLGVGKGSTYGAGYFELF